MAHGQFIVSDVNPNDNMGGGGCVCDPRKQIDCKPPFVVCFANDMEDARSPHVVICKACACRMVELLDGDPLSAGERSTIPETAKPTPARSGAESPVFNDSELIRALKAPRGTPDI